MGWFQRLKAERIRLQAKLVNALLRNFPEFLCNSGSEKYEAKNYRCFVVTHACVIVAVCKKLVLSFLLFTEYL